VFCDERHSGSTLVRPGLEALRDLAAQGCIDVVLCYSPDRLAPQVRLPGAADRGAGPLRHPGGVCQRPARGQSPEDQLLVQFQGMFAEYEKAQLMERYRPGKAYRARSGSVNVLGGAPFGYRYIRKTPDSAARYEIIEHQAVLVAEMFRRYADDGAKVPSLLQGLAACAACGYGYYRTSARTARRKIYYYRCLGSDDYRYEGGRVCGNKPVRADYLDSVVWDHITGLLADPALIRAEIAKRLQQTRTSDLVTRQRTQLEQALAKAATSITAMIEAYSEQLITIDSCAPTCRTCAPASRTSAASSTHSTPRPPTVTPTSPSPATWKASSPGSAAMPPPPAPTTAGGCCGCWSRTS
jgi:hypothetical protein